MKIMAPAGDVDRLTAAVKAGADEVYMGIAGFGARRFANNFSPDEYCSAIDFAHRYGVSVHLTLNTVMSDDELDSLGDDISQLYQTGLDAVIVQDWGVARWLRENFPGLPLHASTQMSLTDPDELNLLAQYGFNRAVLARELSVAEIERIRKKTKLELEVFASGALCLACSGKCYLSSFIGGRSGNRGMCAQPCRHLYRVREEGADLFSFGPEDLNARFYLSLRDQWQNERGIKALMDIGVDSIKIEGRMKSPPYVFEAVHYYRRLIDRLSGKPSIRLSVKGEKDEQVGGTDSPDGSRITSLFNRGYADGYLFEHDPDMINLNFSANFGVEVGRVTPDRNIRLSAPLCNGDGVVWLDADHRKISGQNVSWIDLVPPGRGSRPVKVDDATMGQTIRFEFLPPDDAVYLYKTFDYVLNRELTNRIKQIRRSSTVSVRLEAKVGKPLSLTLRHPNGEITVTSDEPLQAAQKRATTTEELRQGLDRMGETPFHLVPDQCQISASDNVFVPKSVLNGLRQEATDRLEALLVEQGRRKERSAPLRTAVKSVTIISSSEKEEDENIFPIFSAVVRTREQFEVCRQFGLAKVRYSVRPVPFGGIDLNIPSELREEESSVPLAGSLLEAIRYEEQGLPFDSDWTWNIGNGDALCQIRQMFSRLETIFLSPELSESTCRKLVAFTTAVNLKNRSLTDRAGNGSQNNQPVMPRLIRLGLPVFGSLTAMYTRKTLFPKDFVQLVNQDGRPVNIARNSTWYRDGDRLTGSTVFYGEPLDLLDDLGRISALGLNELRLDFTSENGAEVLAILKRIKSPSGRPRSRSYGFERGIF